MRAAPTHRNRPRGQDKWDGVGWRRRSLFGALNLRGPLVDATQAESELLRSHAAGARRVVEIGVFEGAAAAILREAMDPAGELVLIDPYPAGHLLGLNMARIVARRSVGAVPGGCVRWIRSDSASAVRAWGGEPIDLLRIDGEHTLEGVQRDWSDWNGYVVDGGRVALHADVVPAEVGAEDELAAGEAIVPWILEREPGWELVATVDTTAVLRRVSA